ncbi:MULTISPECIES: hypothetical protein [Microbacterium]|uniref:DNA-binding protein n=1 Tax=Microbacterium wangchenii TaxID=2541726 RepID=A0ABX5SMZ1_9MICO|nr:MULTISPECIES: hypothetical protein [Microbacterium]MCK6066545.1 hypothetical protein [Microbacterium sp. EYE_512]QBR87495.1 hypothetical protein E4K62_01550 [Microbacterium wangchenii]TXK14824.1 hypothetical protein FVP99_14175 [Microbacterium wangchenii]
MDTSVGQSTTGAKEWTAVLAHRQDAATAAQVRDRFIEHGVTPDTVAAALGDGGAGLASAATSGRPDWAVPYGGLLGVALVAAEVAAYSSHLVARASAVRSVAVSALLEDFSAVSVAGDLGVSRQKVYEIARDSAKRRDGIRTGVDRDF